MISIQHELFSIVDSYPKAVSYSGEDVLVATIHCGSLRFTLLSNLHLRVVHGEALNMNVGTVPHPLL